MIETVFSFEDEPAMPETTETPGEGGMEQEPVAPSEEPQGLFEDEDSSDSDENDAE